MELRAKATSTHVTVSMAYRQNDQVHSHRLRIWRISLKDGGTCRRADILWTASNSSNELNMQESVCPLFHYLIELHPRWKPHRWIGRSVKNVPIVGTAKYIVSATTCDKKCSHGV